MTAALAKPLQRSRGTGRVSALAAGETTRLGRLWQEGCAKIRLPNTHAEHLEAVLINTSGGLTGGDVLGWTVDAEPNARVVVTTPACERIYRSTGDMAEVSIRMSVASGARIDWLPQETILFGGSRLTRRIDVDLAVDASFLALEAMVLGREAMGEDPRDIVLRDDWRIRREGKLLHAEANRLGGSPLERDGLALLDGARAFATLLYVGPDAERRRAALPERPDAGVGISLSGDRLTVRVLAPSGLALRQSLAPIIAALAASGTLPRLWHI